jgi:protein-disulfide isomerase
MGIPIAVSYHSCDTQVEGNIKLSRNTGVSFTVVFIISRDPYYVGRTRAFLQNTYDAS